MPQFPSDVFARTTSPPWKNHASMQVKCLNVFLAILQIMTFWAIQQGAIYRYGWEFMCCLYLKSEKCFISRVISPHEPQVYLEKILWACRWSVWICLFGCIMGWASCFVVGCACFFDHDLWLDSSTPFHDDPTHTGQYLRVFRLIARWRNGHNKGLMIGDNGVFTAKTESEDESHCTYCTFSCSKTVQRRRQQLHEFRLEICLENCTIKFFLLRVGQENVEVEFCFNKWISRTHNECLYEYNGWNGIHFIPVQRRRWWQKSYLKVDTLLFERISQ